MLHDDTDNTYFVTFGSMHLADDNSIVDPLDVKGCIVANID